MAIRIEIISNNLVITDTVDLSVKLERPAADVYGLAEANKFKIITRTDRGDNLFSADYTNIVDASGAAFNATSLRAFFRTNLGFSKAGAAALTTAQSTKQSNVGTRIFTTGIVGSNTPGAIFLGGSFANDGSDVGTDHIIMELGDYTDIQLIYGNITAQPQILRACIAAPTDFVDKVQDALFITAGVNNIAVTFNGADSIVSAPMTNGGHPVLFCSDWMPLRSKDRTDEFNGLPLVAVRTEHALPNGTNQLVSSWDYSRGPAWETTGKFKYWGRGVYGAKLNAAIGAVAGSSSRHTLMGVRYRSPHKVMTIMLSGTSLTNNNTNTLERWPGGWAYGIQRDLSTRERPIEIVNFGQSSQSSFQYRDSFERNNTVIDFTHAIIEGYSVNDMGTTVTDSQLANNLANVIAIADQCQQYHSAQVGVWSGYPRANFGGAVLDLATDNRRLAYLEKLRGLFGANYIDANKLVAAPGVNPQTWGSTAWCNDNIHPVQAGTDVAQSAFNGVVQRWANAYFGA